MDDLDHDLRTLLRDQRGIARRDQLTARGVTRAQLRWRLDRQWRVVLPGVIAAFTGTLDPQQRLIAASLFAGPDAVVTSTTAARWRGLRIATGADTIQLAVPADRYARSTASVRVRRTVHPDPHPWHRGALAIASPGRAVADAARDAFGEREATPLVIEAVQRGMVSIPVLERELELGPRAGSRLLRAGIRAAQTAAWSVPEHDLLGLVRCSGVLPQVWVNPELIAADGTRLPRPDLWFDDVALAIQVHSWLHHARHEDWEGTIMRDGIFAEYGVPTLGFTPRRIDLAPEWVLARIEKVYATLQGSARPDVRAQPQRLALV